MICAKLHNQIFQLLEVSCLGRLVSNLPSSSRCRLLDSYKAHVTDVCPECGVSPHYVEHLFHCRAH